MNVIATLSEKRDADFETIATYAIGMPALSYGGLSENWLLKECGDRHWRALARAFEVSSPEFRDNDGNRLYAAFLAYRLKPLSEDKIGENDLISISTILARSSQSQYLSTHIVRHQGRDVIGVELLSTFLRRNVAGSNRSVERKEPSRATAMPISFPSESLADDARRIRTGKWVTHKGFKNSSSLPLAELEFRPCPNSDFNGADFLYFASFQTLVDRAEWDWNLPGSNVCRTVSRDIFYYGNIDVGERIWLVLQSSARDVATSRLHTWIRIFRSADRRLIADSFSEKAMQPFGTENASYKSGATK